MIPLYSAERQQTFSGERSFLRWSRRNFITSLCSTPLVLTLDDILALAAPQNTMPTQPQTGSIGARPTYNAQPRPAAKHLPSPIGGTPLGVSFIDVARESGLKAKTIYGG